MGTLARNGLIAVLVFELLSHKVLFINTKRQQNLLKSRLPFLKMANFMVKLLQNYKYLKRKSFRIFLHYVSNHLSVLFQFA